MTKRGTVVNIQRVGKTTRKTNKMKAAILIKARKAKHKQKQLSKAAEQKLEYRATDQTTNDLIKKHFNMPKPIYSEETT